MSNRPKKILYLRPKKVLYLGPKKFCIVDLKTVLHHRLKNSSLVPVFLPPEACGIRRGQAQDLNALAPWKVFEAL